MNKLNCKGIIKVFLPQKINATTRIMLKTPKTDSSIRTVWIPKILAIMLKDYKEGQFKHKQKYKEYYHDYNLIFAMNNGNPTESSNIRYKLKMFCKKHDFNQIVFHSFKHLSISYKLKLINGDIKSVQGDSGHAESDMILNVYNGVYRR